VRTKPKPKPRYRLRNWREYNAALVRRGSLTLWCDEAAAAGWVNRERTGRRGRSPTYTALAVGVMLTLKAVYRLPLRATVGLVRSVLTLLGHTELPVAHPSTLSRRARRLAVALPVRPAAGPLHLVVDTTGLKLYGEGEWKVRQHGWTRRRTWRKLHLGVDEATGELHAVAVTEPRVGDGQHLPALLAQVAAPLTQVTGDGGYDTRGAYDAVAARPEHPRAVFPPPRERRVGQRVRRERRRPAGWQRQRRRSAAYRLRIRQHGNAKAPPLDRDEHVRAIRRVGRTRWKQQSGYHRRSLAETAVFRFKRVGGAHLSARLPATQTTEVRIRAAALNRMTHLGMPDSYAVTTA
jgi:Transposase DDE domain